MKVIFNQKGANTAFSYTMRDINFKVLLRVLDFEDLFAELVHLRFTVFLMTTVRASAYNLLLALLIFLDVD